MEAQVGNIVNNEEKPLLNQNNMLKVFSQVVDRKISQLITTNNSPNPTQKQQKRQTRLQQQQKRQSLRQYQQPNHSYVVPDCNNHNNNNHIRSQHANKPRNKRKYKARKSLSTRNINDTDDNTVFNSQPSTATLLLLTLPHSLCLRFG